MGVVSTELDSSTGMARIYFSGGEWRDESPALIGPGDHAFWMASTVFDGARAFGGLAPDLDLHCSRLVDSARKLGLSPILSTGEILEICREAIRRLPKDGVYYVRPMFYPTAGLGLVIPDPDSTRFALAVEPVPFPVSDSFTATLSPFRRPAPNAAPTDAKASCLYPNGARALADSRKRGFGNALMLDPWGNVAEFASANVFAVKDGVARTPAPNGTFLSGITRARIAELLTGAGVKVEEATLSYRDILDADEVFSTGNYGKVLRCAQMDGTTYPDDRIYRLAQTLYFEFAETARVF